MTKIGRKATPLTLVGVGLALSIGAGCAQQQQVQRFGSVIGVKEEAIPRYKELHANTWPGVLQQIRQSNIRNYSIYLGEVEPGQYYLFSYFEYVGDDFEGDMAKMAEDPTTQRWWEETNPLQRPLPLRAEGEWWLTMEEVFHTD